MPVAGATICNPVWRPNAEIAEGRLCAGMSNVTACAIAGDEAATATAATPQLKTDLKYIVAPPNLSERLLFGGWMTGGAVSATAKGKNSPTRQRRSRRTPSAVGIA